MRRVRKEGRTELHDGDTKEHEGHETTCILEKGY
jgi:hypothetical protein